MSTPNAASDLAQGGQTPRRVVEAEFRLPKLEDIKLPEIDLEPVRTVVEQVLLTGIGVSVLIARGLSNAIKAAHQAGTEAAQDPDSAANALLSLVQKREKTKTASPNQARVKVPALPIDNYDQLAVADILERLANLSPEELRLLRSYEGDHQARADLLEAIDQRLAES